MTEDGMNKRKSSAKLVYMAIFVLMVLGFAGFWIDRLHSTIINQRNNNFEIINSHRKEVSDLNRALKNQEQTIRELQKELGGKPYVLYGYIRENYKKVPRELAKVIAEETHSLSDQYRLPISLISGIMEVESSYDPLSVSKAGARGLMQVMPEWLDKLGYKSVYDFHNVKDGIEAGIRVFMVHFFEEEEDLSSALFAYVNGDEDYIGKVFEAMGRYEMYKAGLSKEEKVDGKHREKTYDEGLDGVPPEGVSVQ